MTQLLTENLLVMQLQSYEKVFIPLELVHIFTTTTLIIFDVICQHILVGTCEVEGNA